MSPRGGHTSTTVSVGRRGWPSGREGGLQLAAQGKKGTHSTGWGTVLCGGGDEIPGFRAGREGLFCWQISRKNGGGGGEGKEEEKERASLSERERKIVPFTTKRGGRSTPTGGGGKKCTPPSRRTEEIPYRRAFGGGGAENMD